MQHNNPPITLSDPMMPRQIRWYHPTTAWSMAPNLIPWHRCSTSSALSIDRGLRATLQHPFNHIETKGAIRTTTQNNQNDQNNKQLNLGYMCQVVSLLSSPIMDGAKSLTLTQCLLNIPWPFLGVARTLEVGFPIIIPCDNNNPHSVASAIPVTTEEQEEKSFCFRKKKNRSFSSSLIFWTSNKCPRHLDIHSKQL